LGHGALAQAQEKPTGFQLRGRMRRWGSRRGVREHEAILRPNVEARQHLL
jgi:hypothetical protein